MIITNNPAVTAAYEQMKNVRYVEGSYRDVLVEVRNLVHIGHEQVTHPLMGSLKPNETPYRSVVVSDEPVQGCHTEAILIIEESIAVFDRFARTARPDRGAYASENAKRDFREIDLSLLKSALDA